MSAVFAVCATLAQESRLVQCWASAVALPGEFPAEFFQGSDPLVGVPAPLVTDAGGIVCPKG